MSDDRRAATRFKIAIEVTMESEDGKFAALTGDVSRGGAFLPTFREIPVGTSLRFIFTIPGSGEVTARGAVRWCGKTPAGQGLGISFDEMTDEHRQLFTDFCEKHGA